METEKEHICSGRDCGPCRWELIRTKKYAIPCRYFLKGRCKNPHCRFQHLRHKDVPICENYLNGNCERGRQCSFKHHGSVCSTVPSEFIVTLDSTPASDDFTNDSGTLSSECNINQVNATFHTAVSQPNSDENVPNQLVSSLENTEKPKVIFTLAGISSKATSELLQFTSKNTSSFNRCQERGVAAICPPNRSYVLDKFDFTHSGPSVADQQTNIKNQRKIK